MKNTVSVGIRQAARQKPPPTVLQRTQKNRLLSWKSYPQKLWITLWTNAKAQTQAQQKIA